MRTRVLPRSATPRADDPERIALVLAPLVALGAALLTPADVGRLLGPCPFHLLTGFPCPTCGVTRALVALGHADWLAAFRVQPLVTLVLSAGVLYLPWAVGVVLRGRNCSGKTQEMFIIAYCLTPRRLSITAIAVETPSSSRSICPYSLALFCMASSVTACSIARE